MPRTYPSYRLHKPSGQAIVVLSGKTVYLGPFNSKSSRQAYDRHLAEWLAAGRRLPSQQPTHDGITVVELTAAYFEFAKGYYRKDGKPTGSLARVKAAISQLNGLYGRTAVAEFGPLKLRAVQQQLIEADKSRRYTNYVCEQIKRIFKWGVSMEMVPASIFQAISTVPGLRQGRTEAAEPEPIGPVDDAVVDKTLPHMPRVVADMVRLQRLTGARPGEVCLLRPCDVDSSGEVWKYVPHSHKTQHHGRKRIIFLGPQAQDVVRPYLLRAATDYCFSPSDSVRHLHLRRYERRQTPLGQGNAPGTNRSRTPKRTAGKCYTTLTYGRAISRACEIAFGMPSHLRNVPRRRYDRVTKTWIVLSEEERSQLLHEASQWRAKHCWHANQLRHSVATLVRREFGLESAQCVLGHAHAAITEVYAERDMQRAALVAAKIG